MLTHQAAKGATHQAIHREWVLLFRGARLSCVFDAMELTVLKLSNPVTQNGSEADGGAISCGLRPSTDFSPPARLRPISPPAGAKLARYQYPAAQAPAEPRRGALLLIWHSISS